jgi:hypothetical protein
VVFRQARTKIFAPLGLVALVVADSVCIVKKIYK